MKKGKLDFPGGAKPGMEIVVTGHIALEGTAVLAKTLTEELAERLPRTLVERAQHFGDDLSVEREETILPDIVSSGAGACIWHEVREGGIFTALWEMAAASDVGIAIDILSIPVLQETIEICEMTDVHPYRLISGGCMLIFCENGAAVTERFERCDIPAVVIGRLTEDNKCIILRDGEESFLERHAGDELKKCLKKRGYGKK